MSLYVCTETARLQTEAACQTISTRADLAATFFSAAQAHLRPHPKSIFLSAFCGVTGMGCDLLSVCLGGNHHVPADLEARSRRGSDRLSLFVLLQRCYSYCVIENTILPLLE